MIINFKGRKVEVGVKRADSFGKVSGLMFKGSNTSNLLFEFGRKNFHSIHSLFVFFPFLAVWLDGNEVVGCEIVKPFRFSVVPSKKFDRLVEIPLNLRNFGIVKFLVDKAKI